MKKAAAFFALCVAIAMTLGGCAEEPKKDEYERGYEDGREDGYETGREDGVAEAYEGLVDDGVLELVELVYLDFDNKIYHGYYCELVNHDNETTRKEAEEEGFSPCTECGGDGIDAYAPVGGPK